VADIAGKTIHINHIPGPLGVRGRNSDNRLIDEKLGWKPSQPLSAGLAVTYEWIERQVMLNGGYDKAIPNAAPSYSAPVHPQKAVA